MYETCHDELQPYSGEGNKKLTYADTDSFVLSFETENLVTSENFTKKLICLILVN